jgi:hypothetical protein
MGVDLLLISFLRRSTRLLLGCVLNGKPCISKSFHLLLFTHGITTSDWHKIKLLCAPILIFSQHLRSHDCT